MSTLVETEFGKANINSRGYFHIVSVKEGNFGKKLHRLIYEKYYGVTLLSDTDIHHIDGNKLNNDIHNLEALLHSEHSKRHMVEFNPMAGNNHAQEIMFKMSKHHSTTGFYRVYKKIDRSAPNGFYWAYQYYENKKRKQVTQTSLLGLKEKVLSRGLMWCVLDETIAKLTCDEYDYDLDDLM